MKTPLLEIASDVDSNLNNEYINKLWQKRF